ncbi:carbonic anhydrase 4-like [Crotalus tigris]|uniref:carbonic anhydrase 4-like n=1 Tax=Crotalus tigris TaxID=88082 RepID=UPI00192F3640|nr:carbonic anhydrase 4-like [Crotalus tigris]
MGSVGFPLKLSACILFFLILENFCVTCDSHWCYDKPECGPSTWGTIGFCGGTRQSPINIDHKKVVHDSSLGPIYFNGYEDRKIVKQMKNTGYHLQITFNSKATISGPGLPAVYWLHSAHWHWGTQNTRGAEHTINGQRYAMEMHVVHTKNNMSLEDAKKDPEGLLVLAFFMRISQGVYYITPWTTLANLLDKIPEKDNFWDLNGEFSLGGLLKTADVSCYYRYSGSLTSPNCEESVIWIVFREPIGVHSQVVEKMTNSLYFTIIQENRRMQNNFRFVQPLNGRKVYYYQEVKTLGSCLQRCFSIIF